MTDRAHRLPEAYTRSVDETAKVKNRCACGQYWWMPQPDVEEFYQGGRKMYCPGCGASCRPTMRLPEDAF